MKSFAKLFLLLPLAFSMSLAGCKETKKSSSTTSDPTSSEVVPGSSEGGSTSQGSSTSEGEPSSSEPEEISYSVEQVVADINSTFSSLIGGDLLSYNSTYGYYSGGLYFDEEGEDYSNTQAEESVLEPVLETYAYYLPEYLGTPSYHFWTSEEDYWEDESGDTVAEIYYGEIPGGLAEVDVVSYCYNNHLIGVVYVYAAE